MKQSSVALRKKINIILEEMKTDRRLDPVYSSFLFTVDDIVSECPWLNKKIVNADVYEKRSATGYTFSSTTGVTIGI